MSKQLYYDLIEAGRFEDAKRVGNGLSLGRRTTGSLGDRGELVARARDIGMDSSDLFVPEEPWNEKFRADMGAMFTRQGLGLQQLAAHTRGGDTQNIDERVAAEERAYQETGLGDEFTGGQLVGGLAEGLAGGYLARGALATAPYITSSAMGAAEMLPEPVVGSDGGAVRGNEYFSGKVQDMLTGVAFGAGGEAVPMGAVRGAEGVSNLPGRGYRRIAQPSSNERGGVVRGSQAEQDSMIDLQDRSGINFTPGQVSGSPAIKQAEELARTNIFTRNSVADSDAGRVKQLNTFIKSFRDSLGDAAPIEVIAPKIQAFGRDMVGRLKKIRSDAATVDYRSIREAAGGQPYVNADNYRSTLMDIVEEGKGTGASPSSRTAATEANLKLQRLEEQGGKLTGMDIDNLTRAEGFVGGDNPFNKTGADTRIQSRIRDSVEQDASYYPDIDEQLKLAKSNYKKNSATIDEFEVNILGQVIGDEFASDLTKVVSGTVPPEKLFAKFTAPGTSPTQVRAAFAHLDLTDPELSNQFRASIVERARQAAKVKPAAAGEATGDIDPGTFLRNLGISGGERGLQGLERLAEIFPDDPEFLDAVRGASTILADKSLMNTSKTETQGAARQAMEAASGMITGTFTGLAHLVGSGGVMQFVSRRMADPGLSNAPLGLPRVRGNVARVRPGTMPVSIEAGRQLEREYNQ